jgi:hypothetical protein
VDRAAGCVTGGRPRCRTAKPRNEIPDDPMTEIVVMKIVVLAKAGENFDPLVTHLFIRTHHS